MGSISKNKIDRTTRLVVTLTIFGATWYVLLGTIRLWFNTFSMSAYTKSLLNLEHFLAALVLTVVLAVTFAFVKYLYAELQTYQNFEDDILKEKILGKADESYSNIFKVVKNSLNIVGALLVIWTIFHMIFEPKSIKALIVGFIIAVLIFGVVVLVGKKKLKDIFKYIERVEKKLYHFFNWYTYYFCFYS